MTSIFAASCRLALMTVLLTACSSPIKTPPAAPPAPAVAAEMPCLSLASAAGFLPQHGPQSPDPCACEERSQMVDSVEFLVIT